MKRLCALIAIVAFVLAMPVAAQAGEESLYFIVGSPYEYSGIKFPVTLRRLGTSGLETVLEIADENTGSIGLKEYLGERLIVVRSEISANEERATMFSIIKMDSPLDVKRFEIKYPWDHFNLEAYIFNIPDKGLYQVAEIASTKEEKLEAFNLTTLKKEFVPYSAFRYAVLDGKVGGGIMDKDYIGAYMNEQGRVVIRKGGKFIETPWTLPNDIHYKTWMEKLISIQVNNRDIMVISPEEERVEGNGGKGQAAFYILDKKTDKWHKLNLKGNFTMLRGFGKWLGGYIAAFEETNEKHIPGVNKNMHGRKTGFSIEERYRMLHENPDGTLFIYNTDTRKKYEIETGQGDSEVLLVEGGYVYYRVYDEIYKAKIGRSSLGEPELLVKDDAVPDIHWVFFGPEVEVPAAEGQEER